MNQNKRLTRGESIVLFCRECMGYDGHRGGTVGIPYVKAGLMVRECEDKVCSLWPFRNGKEETTKDDDSVSQISLHSVHAAL